jgi:2-oxoacid:acceptor oxidoreductase gamma subunit (pyruvate/2-ketoisovalerate family)
MIEIRFHGRGGQGIVIASKILACALFKQGKFVQAFPAFGVERRGAPVLAFTRVDDSFIELRNYIENPDYVVVLDQTLIEKVDVTSGLKSNGLILINSDKKPEHFKKFLKFKIATVDATKIAIKYNLGTKTFPIVNTSILGAFAKATKIVNIKSIKESIKEEMPYKKEENIKALQEAYEKVIL